MFFSTLIDAQIRFEGGPDLTSSVVWLSFESAHRLTTF
jgi:hypothetical protein